MDTPREQRLGPRWRVGIGIGWFLVAVAATIPWYELPDAARFRRLVQVHESKAVECRRLERLARSANRAAEAATLARSAGNFERFAEAYRVQLTHNRLNVIELMVRSVQHRRE